MSIGGSGFWQKSIWEQGQQHSAIAKITGVRDVEEWRTTGEDPFILQLQGSDKSGYLGTNGRGLNEAEVRRIQAADVLMFRLPYRYTPESDYQESKSGSFRFPKKDARYILGENEWHIPLTGSRLAIDKALRICATKLASD